MRRIRSKRTILSSNFAFLVFKNGEKFTLKNIDSLKKPHFFYDVRWNIPQLQQYWNLVHGTMILSEKNYYSGARKIRDFERPSSTQSVILSDRTRGILKIDLQLQSNSTQRFKTLIMPSCLCRKQYIAFCSAMS